MTTLLSIENLETLLHTGNAPIRAVDGLTLKFHKAKPLPYWVNQAAANR